MNCNFYLIHTGEHLSYSKGIDLFLQLHIQKLNNKIMEN